MKKVEIFTDGGCKGNPGPGGYGCILKQGDFTEEIKGGNPQTTNNIMEMTAVIVALKQLKEPCEVRLTTDSQYVVKGMTEWIKGWIRNGWKTASRQPVKNQKLWQELDKVCSPHTIKWLWVRGHNGHPQNERCDQLANEAIAEL
jgi:ribonuclease HI